tara:strand:- start:570 stop:1454 length:885 start_codon:yes stop_codon:yes gene_type:complete
MEAIKEYVSNKRSTLSASSVRTYASILKNLYAKVFGDTEYDMEKFNNPTSTIKYLGDYPPNRRKTILSALVIITANKEYRDLMLKDVRDYNKEINQQEKTPEQEASWVSDGEIKEVYNDLKKNADIIYKKKDMTGNDLQQIQNYIIMSVLGSIFIAPRRSKDYVDFKIKNIDDKTDNYMKKNKFYFNSYKTFKTYGEQIVDIPVQLRNIIIKWSKFNPTEHLLFDSNFNKLSAVKLNQRLNKIFQGKKVGVNQLRHTFLTEKYGDTIKKEEEMKETMEDMGSSASMLKTYVKKD